MKRIILCCLILAMMLGLPGCKKDQSRVEVGTPVALEDLEMRYREVCVDYFMAKDVNDLQKWYDPATTVVFRGVKEGLSTPVLVNQKNGMVWDESYCETPLLVLECYYGEVKPGDHLICREHLAVYEPYYVSFDNVPAIEADCEYIFIYNKTEKKAQNGEPLYEGIGLHQSNHKIEMREEYRQKVQDHTAKWYEAVSLDVLDFYLNDET